MRTPSQAYLDHLLADRDEPGWAFVLPQLSAAWSTMPIVGATIEPVPGLMVPGKISRKVRPMSGQSTVSDLTVSVVDDGPLALWAAGDMFRTRALLYHGYRGLPWGDWESVWRGAVVDLRRPATGNTWAIKSADVTSYMRRPVTGPLTNNGIALALHMMLTTAAGDNGPYDIGTGDDLPPYGMAIPQEDVDVAEWESVRDWLVENRAQAHKRITTHGIRPHFHLPGDATESDGLAWLRKKVFQPLGISERIRGDGRLGCVPVTGQEPGAFHGLIGDVDIKLLANAKSAPSRPKLSTTRPVTVQAFGDEVELVGEDPVPAAGQIEIAAGSEKWGANEAAKLDAGALRDDIGAWKATLIETTQRRLRRHSAPHALVKVRAQMRQPLNIEIGDVAGISTILVPTLHTGGDTIVDRPHGVESMAVDYGRGDIAFELRDWGEIDPIIYRRHIDEQTSVMQFVPGDAEESPLEPGVHRAFLGDPLGLQESRYIRVRIGLTLQRQVPGFGVLADWHLIAAWSDEYDFIGTPPTRGIQRTSGFEEFDDDAPHSFEVYLYLWDDDELNRAGHFRPRMIAVSGWVEPGPFPFSATGILRGATLVDHRWDAPPGDGPIPDEPIVGRETPA